MIIDSGPAQLKISVISISGVSIDWQKFTVPTSANCIYYNLVNLSRRTANGRVEKLNKTMAVALPSWLQFLQYVVSSDPTQMVRVKAESIE
jgi:hypothetical protein